MQWKMADRKMVRLNWKKKDGSAGTAQGVSATSSDDSVVTAAVSGDYVYLTNVAPGFATITVVGDTDPGDGVKNVQNAFDVEILNDFAETLEFGDPEDQPPAA